MTTEPNDVPPSFNYKLVCTDCTFETTVEGSFLDALDVADSHQEDLGAASTEHFVNVELNGQG